MRFSFTTEPATFVDRPNRFLVIARLRSSGEIISAHCPDPGRLRELLIAGATVHVSPAQSDARRTAYDLRFVEHPEHGQLISMDTRLPNRLFLEGLHDGFFAPFRCFRSVQHEVSLPSAHDGGIRSRIDYRLLDAVGRPLWVEVKSATLVEEGCAMFPDAVTARGRRHVLELAQRAVAGERAAIVFIVQRPDAQQLRPHWERDAAFGHALVDAHGHGVELYAYACRISTAEVALIGELPVILDR